MKLKVISILSENNSKLHKFGSVVGFVFNKLFMLALIVLALGFVPIVVVATTITNSDKVKQVLDEGDIYTTVVDNALYIIEVEPESEDNNQPGPDKQNNGEHKKSLYETLEDNNLIKPDELTIIIKSTLDREYLKSQVEPAIDSSFDYLSGDAENLKVSFTLKDRADKFESEFKAFLLKELKDIPACPANQNDPSFDNKKDDNLLEATCLPANSNLESEIDKAISEFTNEGPFNTVYDQDELNISKVDLNNGKTAYSALQKLPLVFWIMFVLVSAAIIMTGSTIYRGFKEVGIITFVAGILLMIEFAVIGNPDTITSRITDTDNLSPQNQAILNITQPLAESAAGILQTSGIQYGAIISAIGIACFVAGIFLKKHHYEHIHMPHFHHDSNSTGSPQVKPPEPNTTNKS